MPPQAQWEDLAIVAGGTVAFAMAGGACGLAVGALLKLIVRRVSVNVRLAGIGGMLGAAAGWLLFVLVRPHTERVSGGVLEFPIQPDPWGVRSWIFDHMIILWALIWLLSVSFGSLWHLLRRTQRAPS